jgi:TusA-related sulfurtransferase
MKELTPRPAGLDARHAVEVDVRDDIRVGGEPFPRILAAVKALEPSEVLVVRAPFEPAPLYAVLGRRGLAHWTERVGVDDWRVWFWFESIADAPAAPTPPAGGATVDVRGLEPPLPMVQVLERLEALEPGATLTVLHERRPMLLYAQLDARGFGHETDELEPGLVRIVIRRSPG